MVKIGKIIIHHSGGLGSNNYASTRFVTPRQISNYHKRRWNFSSKYIDDKDLKYMGYNAIYDPKTRKFMQGRAIGEETAHTIGENSRSFGLCVIGNYNKQGGKLVDPVTPDMEKDIGEFLYDLKNGNRRRLVVVPGTVLSFSYYRMFPHRKYSRTMCYGMGLKDNFWARLALTVKNKVKRPVSHPPRPAKNNIQEQLKLIQRLIFEIQRQIALLRRKRRRSLGGRDDDENLPENINDY